VMLATAAPAPAAEKPRKKKPHDYRVRPGDSLIAIAREHSCDVGELAKANRLRSPSYMIKPGQRLKLKGCGES
jgi:membrane-bound lytic murein transglycosylase D